MSWGYDDEEAERELEEARRADRSRRGAPVTMGQIIPLRGKVPGPGEPDQLLTCEGCGFSSSTHRGWRLSPLAARLLCAGRYDESGAQIDCFDKADRQLQQQNDRLVADTARVIGEAKERGFLTDGDRAFLKRLPGGQDSIDALEKRFKAAKEKQPRGGHAP